MENQINQNTGEALAKAKMARTSVLIGIVMLAGWLLPFIAFPLAITGIIFGFLGLSSARRDLARAGIFLNSLTLGITLMNLAVGLYMLLTDRINPLIFF